MSKIITIEMIVPDNAGNDVHDIVHEAREIFHKTFKGNQDYIDSNVVVWDNNMEIRKETNDTSFTKTGLLVDFKNCKDKTAAAGKLMVAFTDLIKSPEYIGMIFGGHDNNDKAETTETTESSDHGAKVIFEFKVPDDCELFKNIEHSINIINDNKDKDEDTSIFDENNDDNCCNRKIRLISDFTDDEYKVIHAKTALRELNTIVRLPGMPLHENTLSIYKELTTLRKNVKRMMCKHSSDSDAYKQLRDISDDIKSLINSIYGDEHPCENNDDVLRYKIAEKLIYLRKKGTDKE